MQRRTSPYGDVAWFKRQLRRMRKQEQAIRFAGAPSAGHRLVWDSFFSLSDHPAPSARYSMEDLLGMTRPQFEELVDEFFFEVYYVYYKERGMLQTRIYNPADLADLGVAPHAGKADIRRRFRELAKQHHPDMGGDTSQFIRLLQAYERLMG